MTVASGMRRVIGSAALVGLAGVAPAVGAPPVADLAPARSGPRTQAVAALSAATPAPPPCLTALVHSIRSDRQRGTSATRRALAVLANDPGLPGERFAADADGNTVRYTSDRNASDRVESGDDNGNGRPDAVDEALAGVARAQRLLVGQLDLPNPGPVEIVLGRLGSNVDALSAPFAGRPGRTRVWLDPAVRGGTATIRRNAEHQYAHAVAAAAGLDPAWGEAFAVWAALALEGTPDDRALSLLTNRLAEQGAGLVTDDLELAGGNAAWFTFLNEAYGPTAVKLAVEELGHGGSDQAALDRALRRATGDTIDAALRDYQVWSLLVGPRDDGRHFPFASRLPGPVFASSSDALPALSIQSDPEVGPMGQAAVLLRSNETSGGLTLRFEGDLAARWAADLVVVRNDELCIASRWYSMRKTPALCPFRFRTSERSCCSSATSTPKGARPDAIPGRRTSNRDSRPSSAPCMRNRPASRAAPWSLGRPSPSKVFWASTCCGHLPAARRHA